MLCTNMSCAYQIMQFKMDVVYIFMNKTKMTIYLCKSEIHFLITFMATSGYVVVGDLKYPYIF